MESMSCPACGAALKVDKEIGIVNCKYCGMPVKISTDEQIMRHESVTKLIEIGNYSEAYKLVLKLMDENPNVPTLWLLRGNCSQSVSDRDSSYKMADELLKANPTELKLLEIQWTSMVFNWGCELSINDSTFKLGGMQKYRTLLPEGEYTINLESISNNLSAQKLIKLEEHSIIKLVAEKRFFSKQLTIKKD